MAEERIAAIERALVTRIGNLESLVSAIDTRFREITLELTDAARRHLTAVGYDPLYGARPLKRVLQRELETELGRQILAGSIPDRSAVKVDYREGKLVFEPASIEAAA